MSLKTISNNEMDFILTIFKSPEIEYNASSISRQLKISSMGALKIAKKLEKEEILSSKQLGRAKFYKLNLNNEYVKQYVKFLLKKESEQASAYVKRWINEIKKIKNADLAVLYGSVLKKYEKANDIDILLITDKKRFSKLKKEIGEINLINVKKVHPMYQTKIDFKKNIEKKHEPILDAIKGFVVFGEDTLINLLKK